MKIPTRWKTNGSWRRFFISNRLGWFNAQRTDALTHNISVYVSSDSGIVIGHHKNWSGSLKKTFSFIKVYLAGLNTFSFDREFLGTTNYQLRWREGFPYKMFFLPNISIETARHRWVKIMNTHTHTQYSLLSVVKAVNSDGIWCLTPREVNQFDFQQEAENWRSLNFCSSRNEFRRTKNFVVEPQT